MVNLQKIFALDMLEKNRLGETKEVLDTLEVAWKLNQSAREYPSLIGSLVAAIVDNYIVGVIRKIKEVPSDWQARITRLVKEDYSQSFSTSLNGEFLTTARSLGTYPLWKWTNNAQPPLLPKYWMRFSDRISDFQLLIIGGRGHEDSMNSQNKIFATLIQKHSNRIINYLLPGGIFLDEIQPHPYGISGSKCGGN
jgi:hypothetical protein